MTTEPLFDCRTCRAGNTSVPGRVTVPTYERVSMSESILDLQRLAETVWSEGLFGAPAPNGESDCTWCTRSCAITVDG